MKVHVAINLMHCRGHFRKKKKKKRPLIRKAYTHAQKKAPWPQVKKEPGVPPVSWKNQN